MAMTINTNMAAENAQKNLARTQNALNRSLERLSSGLRINSAKDDAAGMAISNRFTAQIRGIDQSIRNANDGISLMQTSEGAMQEVTNILQRMREIAVQASNDTYSQDDRASMQNEIDQLYSEIDRISGATQFNGINLLDGSGGTRSFQIGPNSGQNISVSLMSVKTKDLHLNGYSALGDLNSGRISDVKTDLDASTSVNISGLTINGVTIEAAATTSNTAKAAAAMINDKTGQTGVTATAYNTVRGGGNVSGIVNGLEIGDGTNTYTVSNSGNMNELVDNINRDVADVTATLNSDGSITLSNDTGKTIVIGGTVTNSGFTAATYTGYLSLKSGDNEPIEIAATDDSISDLQGWGFNVSTGSSSVIGGEVSSTAFSEGDLFINGVDVGKSSGSSAGDKAAAINSVTEQTGVSASAKTEQTFTLTLNSTTVAATDVTINGSTVDLSAITNLEDAIKKINDSVKGVVATSNALGKLVLTSVSGLDITVTDADGNTGIMGLTTTSDTFRGTITLTSETGADIVIAGSAADATTTEKAGFTTQGGSSEAVGSGLSVMNLANANNAIERLDDALNQVSDNRGELGAIQNRLSSTIANLQNVAENFTAANGRILDADFAKETAEMTKAQILTQAGVAMLAQAKQLPQQVMQLLQQ